MKRHIPNFLTCCNLFCGCMGIVVAMFALNVYSLQMASWLIFAACIFDFFDGFVARLLKVSSPIGKELDSLADVVTFGVLPGMIILKLMMLTIDPLGLKVNALINIFSSSSGEVTYWAMPLPGDYKEHILFNYIPYIFLVAFIVPVFSALRLAKFNIDTRQSDKFIGVPTPANAILIASFPLILAQNKFEIVTSLVSNAYFLISVVIIMSLLLVAELPLLALKFKSFKWEDNKVRFSFLLVSALLLIFLNWTAIPLIIIIYIVISIAENLYLKSQN